jgi:6-phosphogluconolactonase
MDSSGTQSNKLHLNIYTNESKFKKAFVIALSDFIKNIPPKNTIKIAVSGGKTPAPIYKEIAKSDLPFNRVHLFQVDERYVAKTNSESNFKLIEKTLLKNKFKKLTLFNTEEPLKETISSYSKNLAKYLKGKITFDITILGIGPDGHIASLFPGTTALKKKGILALHTTTRKFAVKDRLTISLPAILKSKKIIILLTGKEKMATLKELVQGKKKPSNFPAKYLLKHQDVNIFYLYK